MAIEVVLETTVSGFLVEHEVTLLDKSTYQSFSKCVSISAFVNFLKASTTSKVLRACVAQALLDQLKL